MELQQLTYFLAAADALHFTRAAHSLGISQPALSLAIQQLERELQTPLFDRIGRSVQLTAAGILFRERAAGLLQHLADARQEVLDLQGLGGRGAGLLRIGITHIFAASLLPGVLARFHHRFPGVFLAVEKLSSAGVEQQLLAGRLDLGITFSPPDAVELLPERLFEEPVVLALPAGHPRAGQLGASVPFDKLGELRLALTTAEFATRQLLTSLAARRGLQLQVAMEFNDIDLLLGTLARTDANANLATVLARRAIGAHAPHFVRLPIVQPGLSHGAYLLWHRDRHRPAAARELAQMIREALPETSHQLEERIVTK
jgi:LysR family cyn operon transcriptional activator